MKPKKKIAHVLGRLCDRFSLTKRVVEITKSYKNEKFYSYGHDKLIKNYGIGAQIKRAIRIKKMILVTRSKKKVVD